MKKKFLTNLLLLVVLNLLVKPFWMFGIDRTVQNTVGSEQYGLYFALFNFSLLLNILLDFGITNFNNRNIAQNEQLLNKHFSNIITIRLLLAVLYLVVSVFLAIVWQFRGEELRLLLFLLLNQFLLSFLLYLRSNIAGLHMFKTDSLLSVLDRLLMILICSILLWTNITDGYFEISWFIYAQTVSYGVSMLIAFAVVLRQSGRIVVRYDRVFTLAILKKSYPYAVLILLMSFYNRFDAVLIERLLPVNGKTEAGIYAQGFRIFDGANMFALLFSSLLLPIFSRMLKQKDEISQMVKISYVLIAVPSILVVVSSFFYRKEIIDLLYHEHVEYSSSIFGVIILSFFAVSTTYIFGTLLTANGSLRKLNIMAGVGMVLSIGLNLLLIPKMAAMGAAITGVITQFFTAFVQVLISIKVFNLKINYRLIFSFVFFTIFVIILGYFTYQLPFHWLLNIFVMITVSVIFAFLFGLFKVKSLVQILKYD